MSSSDQAALIELLNLLRSSSLTVPDELTEHVLRRAGINSTDERTTRLVSLAGLSFLTEVLRKAKDVQKNRSQAPAAHQKAEGVNVRDKRATLLTEDVAKALQEYGVSLKLPPYHVQPGSGGQAPRR